jgi:hypothetical protein
MRSFLQVTSDRGPESYHATVPRACIFCGNEPTTREHLWPAWAAQLLLLHETVSVQQILQREGHPKVEREWNRQPYQEVARVVCARCNNGWMAALEGRTKELVDAMWQGRALALQHEEQRTLAAWALKTAMVFDAAHGKPWLPIVTEEERHTFAATGTLPDNLVVWLAAYLGPRPGRAWMYGAAEATELNDGERRDGTVWGATITLGPVVVQVFYSSVPGMTDAYTLEERPAITLISPYRGVFNWGDREELADDALDQFAVALPTLLRSLT